MLRHCQQKASDIKFPDFLKPEYNAKNLTQGPRFASKNDLMTMAVETLFIYRVKSRELYILQIV